MNLISLIFEIKIQVEEFKKGKDDKPSDINLLFIEEPEAHTHPQMQYVFIKNIKKLLSGGIVKKLKNDEKKVIEIKRKLQYIVSTHSSHIVAESNYDDIKYLKKDSGNSVISKNLCDLEKEYVGAKEREHYRFLKQYLTLNRAELFFTDKAIFIEGDTERILLPAMMKKMDYDDDEIKLLSQNISIVEVGAYSQVFEKFIDFIGMKSLIITDIDSYYLAPKIKKGVAVLKKDGQPELKVEKCSANDARAERTSNSSLQFFHAKKREDLNYFKGLPLKSKILVKDDNKTWSVSEEGNLLIVYQTEELGYHARSFEDAFFRKNESFICNDKNNFKSLTPKWLNKFKIEKNYFELAEKGVESKPSLAIEILMNSKSNADLNEFSNWQIPAYIEEGLSWLKD
jgi:putative ATP-dependent endonuclease of OLD family